MSEKRLFRWFHLAPLALGVALVSALPDKVRSVLDWDFMGRHQFVPSYDFSCPNSDGLADTHILYHWLLNLGTQVGLSTFGAAKAVTAVFYVSFVYVVFLLARSRGLGRGATTVALLAVTVASPGLFVFVLSVEDNVAYHALLLLALHWYTAEAPSRRVAMQMAVGAGACLGVALHINVTLLVVLPLVAGVPVLLALREREAAIRVAVATSVALGVYIAAHATLFLGCPPALSQYLHQAVALKDFDQSNAPLTSFTRVAQYRGGFRSISLTPSTHYMQLPHAWLVLMLDILPTIQLALFATVGVLTVPRRWAELWPLVRRHAVLLGLTALFLVFPYLYEPYTQERWDMFWLVLVLVLVRGLARPWPVRLWVVVGAILVLQTFGTGLAVAHNYGWVFKSAELEQAQAVIAEHRRSSIGLAVLPAKVSDFHSGYLQHFMPETHFVFVWTDSGRLSLKDEYMFRVALDCQVVHSPDCMDSQRLQDLARTVSGAIYVHPDVAARIRSETGVEARP